MNRKQIQIEVCKALLDTNKRCSGCFINETEFAVTTDGFSAYVLHKSECIFDIERVKTANFKPLFEPNEKDEELQTTKKLFVLGDKTVKKFKTENADIYVDMKILKPFEGFHFYGFSSVGRVIVKDDFGRLVGLFLPVRFSEENLRNE